jgi:hypothetical protein
MQFSIPMTSLSRTLQVYSGCEPFLSTSERQNAFIGNTGAVAVEDISIMTANVSSVAR